MLTCKKGVFGGGRVRGAERFAVVIGVNYVEHPRSQLYACVNDANRWRNLLIMPNLPRKSDSVQLALVEMTRTGIMSRIKVTYNELLFGTLRENSPVQTGTIL